MFGFETIGNATLIVHDGGPILATDPWIRGEPYFGSWGMSHQIPLDVLDHIKRSRYLWFSHGHPDHLNADSLHELSDRQILVPDHVGGRIARSMTDAGLNVRVLPTKEWIELSRNIRVMCLPDYNQDATLLVAAGDHLIVDLNDGSARGYQMFIRRLARSFKQRYRERYILIDAPPMTASADTQILADLCDFVVLVVPYGRVTHAQVDSCIKAIGDKKLVGVVFNDEPAPPDLRWLRMQLNPLTAIRSLFSR